MSIERLARRLIERRPRHRVVSLYLDLDPSEQFATPGARESQVHSLIDGAAREVDADDSLDHGQLARHYSRLPICNASQPRPRPASVSAAPNT